ncbi:ATP-binding protein [Mesorhizobium sp. LNJC391B00]|uniref:ATP-binding protein n=1 Tax=Mesorhizobium sp. LNJC391B00 TaxID=1287273 RepID=UPI0018DE4952|nr:ATP-binding protein [Mesorhizobium sp. LNJC391B00]
MAETEIRKTKAIANPTKTFFVRMITRDITLEDCILDLIDNSIDGAWSSEGSRPMGLAEEVDLSKYRIDIEALEDSFCIVDNCGGMTLNAAINHAFSFGRQALEEHEDYSIGVYGIGMKRAIFKIGGEINIRSTYLERNGTRQSFVVPINVTEWLKNDVPPWDFDLEESDPLPSNGVEITISELTDGAKAAFASPAFLQNLRRTISRDYSLHLNRGLS